MHTTQGEDIASIAAGLGNDHIHVWRLRYEKARRREPLRALLGSYLGLPAEAVELVESEHGRPELAGPRNGALRFNWSHSGDVALIAVARSVQPGIDIERVHLRKRSMELAERFFHAEEAAALAALDAAQREHAFLQLWTSKEAVLKAMGRGIAFGLDRLHVSVSPSPPRLLWLDGDDVTQWQLHSLMVDTEHVAAVAWRGPPQVIVSRTLAGGL